MCCKQFKSRKMLTFHDVHLLMQFRRGDLRRLSHNSLSSIPMLTTPTGLRICSLDEDAVFAWLHLVVLLWNFGVTKSIRKLDPPQHDNDSLCCKHYWSMISMCKCIAMQSSKLPNAVTQSAQLFGLFWAICSYFVLQFPYWFRPLVVWAWQDLLVLILPITEHDC